ncbi:hypothetical protein DH2020_035893 [Rehmannia glutinosa]|uniref:Endonuclease/exonuclease/phosphatase domain-containing protein n=1 Tax=Rehmannia glutinosa TaxID=99300 RepID=A0ABR0V5A3_REHGL
MEPMTSPNFFYYCRLLGFQQGFANISNKILIFWSQSLNVTIERDHEQVVCVQVSSNTFSRPFHASFVYAKSTRSERHQLWDELRSTVSFLNNQPWIVGGDFNCFLSDTERQGSDTDRHFDIADFGQMVSDCGLIDAGFIKGPIHTWVRNALKERLDRFFINTEWGDIFRKSDVSHLDRAWTGPTGAHGILNLHFKLIRTKQKLQWWNRNIFGNIFDKLHVAENHVSEAEQRYDSDPSPANLTALNRTIAELVLATKIEEDYWHQKSSCKWIVEGERNTKYFHNLVKYKRIKSRIHSVLDNGVNLTEDSAI